MCDPQQFLDLIEKHKGIIVRICSVYVRRKEERDDLFQEIIVQLWRAWPSFEGRSKFSTWMYRIALNTAISGLRKKSTPLVYVEQEGIPDIADIRPDPQKEEQVALLYQAIRALPEIDRALVMLYLDDHSYEEMEHVLGINQGALRTKMNRAKEKLKKNIERIQHGA